MTEGVQNHWVLTVHLKCGHDLVYVDRIEEKYPFYCPECDVTPSGKYPWWIEVKSQRGEGDGSA